MLDPKDYQEIYEMFDQTAALSYDCGSLCNSICCRADAFPDANLFLYIFPGEEALHDRSDPWLSWEVQRTEEHYIPRSWGETFLAVRCHGPEHCRRNLRPIQCRSFPLEPHLNQDGQLVLIYCNFTIPYRCPIMDRKLPLSPDYLRTVYAAWEKLIRDPLIYDYVREVSELRTGLSRRNEAVWPPSARNPE